MILQLLWFALLGVLLIGYAILDGFDLGVGILHLFARGDEERRMLLNSIGPLWDGNEVWLVTFGGALFAAFPKAYATAFSAFYLPFMCLLFALIFRAVSIEFRSKRPGAVWRGFWDASFSGASALAALLFGTAVGDMMRGIPIDKDGEYAGTLLDLLHPYALLVGLLVVALFALHGAVYLRLKTRGELRRRALGWAWTSFGLFLVLYVFATIFTLVKVPSAIHNFDTMPWAWGLVALSVLAIANVPRALFRGKPIQAFLSTAAVIAALVFLFGFGLFPNLVASSLDPAFNLTLQNACSSPKTLGIMALIALCGMPFVLAYTAAIYWVFRGQVTLDEHSY